MARLLWWYLLWLIRRPAIKRLQRYWLNHIVREKRRAETREAVRRQNRFARKWGFRVILVLMNAILVSVVFTLTYLVVINLYDAGVFEVPKK